MEERKSSYNKKNIVYEKDIQKVIEFIETIQFGSITLVIQKRMKRLE